jgi:uncharacterized protein
MIMSEIEKKDKANLNLVRDLIVLGANLDWQDGDSWTALNWCASYNRIEISRILLDAGADKTIPTNDGKLSYEYAKYQELKELLQP